MIRNISKRVLQGLKNYVGRVIHKTRVMRVKRVHQFYWQTEGAKKFNDLKTHFFLETDDANWGYQLRSAPLKVKAKCWAVLRLVGEVTQGDLVIGVLDETESNWLTNLLLPKGSVDQCIVINPKDSAKITIVISNQESGASQLQISSIVIEWVSAVFAKNIDVNESIINEVQHQMAAACPYPLSSEKGVYQNKDNKIFGTGIYLRTDYWVKIQAGGSYGHTCYVAHELAQNTEHLICFMANRFNLLDNLGIEQIVMDTPSRSCNEMDILTASRFYYKWLYDRVEKLKPAYIYERSILGSYVGMRLSRELKIPYILEYNGSETSMRKSFDTQGYELESEFELIEKATFEQATTIVAISNVIKENLITKGVPQEKILVNPNGCSPEHYHPLSSKEKNDMRSQFGWDSSCCVVGFVATFGGWHGIDILEKAIPILCAKNKKLRFVLIGDGNLRHLVVNAVKRHRLTKRVYMPGTIEQTKAAKLLACSDIMISPHSRNMVDSKFFGSPTKLFEYMALGGAIVASRLEQIGEVMSPSFNPDEIASVNVKKVGKERGVLCKPGDLDEFVKAVSELAKRPELRALIGANARNALMENHTWKKHVEKILHHVTVRSSAIKGR